ncbi:hypothetical protein LCGC14_1537350 [marine sediment metagenome]|uniref:Uncharacterized protein n=1 Tax=marine sediment metagenome TaxID=412755 RepID=A0A0F9LUX3_9ZZZZ
MHYHAEVWLPKPEDAEEQVSRTLAPHEEQAGGWWDWWQIGGRWKGAHVAGYDSVKDPAHLKTCWLCRGTGQRTDMVVKDGCNGCAGTGKKVDWPTQWPAHEGDVMGVAELRPDLDCHTLVLPERQPLHVEEWNGKTFVKTGFTGNVAEVLREHGVKAGYLVTVDYHC